MRLTSGEDGYKLCAIPSLFSQLSQSLYYLQHLVRARLNAWWHVAGIKGQLFHLCKIVDRVPVEDQFSHRDQGVLLMRPHL